MSSVSVRWLGQAGFVLTGARHSVAVDAFLSDWPGRLVAPPLSPSDLGRCDVVLATHEHADHLDLPTLLAVRARAPDLPVVVPGPVVPLARSGGLDGPVLGARPGEPLTVADGLVVHAVPALHGVHVSDAYAFGLPGDGGDHRYLGYVVELDGLRIYHAGDTLDHEGLAEHLRELRVDVALLPINGRDEAREAQDIVGNLDVDEAVDLALRAGIRVLVPMHYDMFAGNRGPVGAFVEAVRARLPHGTVLVPGYDDPVVLPDPHVLPAGPPDATPL